MSDEVEDRPPAASGNERHAIFASLVGRPLFWAVAVAILLGWPIARAMRRAMPARLPVLGTLADFALRDQTGRDFGSRDLRGKVWVGNFIFTRCSTVCPRLTTKMGEVQHRSRNLGAAFHLVSFSVDPEHDTPEVLAAYAAQHRVSPRAWTFLTGPRVDVERIVVGGLKAGMGEEPQAGSGSADAPSAMYHDSHFVLVDSRMRIRGYYAVEEDGEIDRLMRDIGTVTAYAARGE